MISQQDKYEKVRGVTIRYCVSGEDNKSQKSSVVFFHGFSFSLDDWKKTGTLDKVTLAGYRVLAMDLPSGKASKSSRLSYDKFSDCVPLIHEFFDTVGFTDNLVIVGPSMGGGFALAYAIAHPEKVVSLVLVSPSLRSINNEDFEKVVAPTMLVWGEKDNVFPAESHARPLKNRLAHSKLIIIKGAGHAAYLDKPGEFNDLLLDFLEEIS